MKGPLNVSKPALQVDFDRNAAKRTSVIDDQSDFFEIDANAWLSDEVYD